MGSSYSPYLFFCIFFINLQLIALKRRKLQETNYITNITYETCPNGYISSLSEFILEFENEISAETSLNGSISNGMNSYPFTCESTDPQPNPNKTIKCTLKNKITIKGDYTLSKLTGDKYNYVSKIPKFTILRVTDKPYLLPELIREKVFIGVEFPVRSLEDDFPEGQPEFFIKEKDTYHQFSCTNKGFSTLCTLPSSITTFG